MSQANIIILWDEAHIWALLCFKAFSSLGLPCVPIHAKEIAQGALFRKPAGSLLVVPGGSARLKANALGENGRRELIHWVHSGGSYLGFCGGAGLALSSQPSLGLCPWQRQQLGNHIEHSLSGPVQALLSGGNVLLAPVWWPGRFAPRLGGDVEILATYHAPGRGLLFGTNGTPLTNKDDFPGGQPLAITGKAGKGKYLLSYAHLETPAWPEANRWLAELLKDRFNLSVSGQTVPEWNIFERPRESSGTSFNQEMLEAWSEMAGLVKLGFARSALFARESWLPGWKRGVPGLTLANLLGAAHFLAERDCQLPQPRRWQELRHLFREKFYRFTVGAREWLDSSEVGAGQAAQAKREKCKSLLFGHPMAGGGLAGELLGMLESME